MAPIFDLEPEAALAAKVTVEPQPWPRDPKAQLGALANALCHRDAAQGPG